eukprot:SAG31_NODE_13266_length_881_cov_1.448849_1_plen_86_part_10
MSSGLLDLQEDRDQHGPQGVHLRCQQVRLCMAALWSLKQQHTWDTVQWMAAVQAPSESHGAAQVGNSGMYLEPGPIFRIESSGLRI